MTQLQVKPLAFDKNDETLYGSKEITLGSKKIFTPIVSVDTRQITRNDQLANATKGLNEIYRRLETKNYPLKGIIFNRKRQDDFNSKIQTEYNRTNSSKEMTLCILEYAGVKYPLGRELEFILDTAYFFSDVVPLPTFPKITANIDDKSKFDQYQIFLEAVIHFLKSNKHDKPVMGVVPRLAYAFVADLMEFYIDKGINAFYVDFEARNPTTFKQNLLPIFRTLAQHDMTDGSFIYAHNIDAGRIVRASDIVNAKDILSFGFGFDAMGRRHKNRKMPKEVRQQIDTRSNRLRLFNKDDYGYYRILNQRKIKEIYPSDSSIPSRIFSRGLSGDVSLLRRYEKLFNTEQLGLEAFRIRQIVKHYVPTEYLATKQHVKEKHIKIIKRFKDDISKRKFDQKTLFDIDSLL